MKVTYLTHMGSDLEVVNDAKVSFGKTSKTLSPKDHSLIQFLARGCSSGEWDRLIDEITNCSNIEGSVCGFELFHDYDRLEDFLHHIRQMPQHWTPFAGSVVKLHLKLPIVVARQFVRSEVGRNYNEISRRYVSDTPEMHYPELRLAAPNVKQGSSDEVLVDHNLSLRLDCLVEHAINLYEEMIRKNVAPEVARFYLPQGIYTELRVTGSLCYWARVVVQRRDPHAQKEIRELAAQIDAIIRPLFPISWEALTR